MSVAIAWFRDPRYMRVDGRPIFVIYAPHDVPSTSDFVLHWRSLAERNGLPGLFFIALGNVYDFEGGAYHHPVYDVFDAITPHTPQDYLETTEKPTRRRLNRRLRESSPMLHSDTPISMSFAMS